jgi:hypothetical protein
MRSALVGLWVVSLGIAFGLARWTAPGTSGSARSLETLRAGLGERDALERAYLLASYLRELRPDEVGAVLELVEARRVDVRPEDVSLLMHGWSRFDAPGAFAWARDWPTTWRDRLMEAAISAWGFRDGPGALAALEELEDEELAARLRGPALDGWFRSSDRLRAGAYIAGVADPRLRRRYTFALAAEAGLDGPDALIAWAEAVPGDAPNDFKQGSFFHAANVLARSDPRRAAAWFEAHRADSYSEGSLDAIARKWAQHHDAPALFDWLRSLPPGEGGRSDEVGSAIAAGFRSWRQRDAADAAAWLAAALPDPALDPAVEELAWSLASPSPEEAVDWALRIEDEKRRERNLTRIVRGWLRRDAGAANAWLAGSELPESLKQSIAESPSAALPPQGRRRMPPRPGTADR